MKIGLLTQYYPPEIGAPQRRLSALAEGLVSRGHRVVVLTAMPSYPKGRTFEGYGGLHRKETLNGVEVHRVPAVPSQSAAMSRRLLNYGSFVGSSAMMGAGCFGARLDVLLTESPPLFLGISGYWLSRACRARWVFNVSDLWPESAVSLGVVNDSAMLRSAYKLESFCYRKAWLVTGQSHSIVENISRRYPKVRTYHFSNGVDTKRFRPEAAREQLRAQLRQGRGCSVLYAGLHGLAQGLDHVVDAAARLDGAGVQITLMGDGPRKQSLIDRVRNQVGIPVRFEDPQPPDEMPSWVASADVSLITLGMYIPGAVPSKLYEAMACGRALVLMASGEPADLVRRYECGLVVQPGDTGGLAAALMALASDPSLRESLGRAARDAAVSRFDREGIVASFAKVLEQGR